MPVSSIIPHTTESTILRNCLPRYQHEHQHLLEFSHDVEPVQGPRKRKANGGAEGGGKSGRLKIVRTLGSGARNPERGTAGVHEALLRRVQAASTVRKVENRCGDKAAMQRKAKQSALEKETAKTGE